jgi:hypothetical protein
LEVRAFTESIILWFRNGGIALSSSDKLSKFEKHAKLILTIAGALQYKCKKLYHVEEQQFNITANEDYQLASTEGFWYLQATERAWQKNI